MMKRFLIACLLAIALMGSVHDGALANAAPPPAKLWFTFEDAAVPSAELEALQLVGCETERCEQPVFVQQYGVCDAEGCLLDPPPPPERSTLDCAGNRCLATIPFPYAEHEYFKLVAQFPDGVHTSAVINGLPSGDWDDWTSEQAWQVKVQAGALSLEKDAAFSSPNQDYKPFFSSFALTLVIELLVAGVGLWLWKQAERDTLVRRLVTVVFINLLTYPLVWLVFPALRQFQPRYLRTLSPYIVGALLVYAAALVWIYVSDKQKRRLPIILTLVSLPITAIFLVIVLVVAAYGNYAIAVPGLSASTAVLSAEVVAVVLEAILLFILNRKSLFVLQAAVLSLAMNLASFLVGQVVF